MVAEAQEVICVEECNKMQTLSSKKLPELIKSFELKLSQQKDVFQVKSKGGKPVAKMKLREPQEVLEIARLKLLISEIREKTVKMEAQLQSAAENHGKEIKNTIISEQINMQDEKIKTASLLVDKVGDNLQITSATDKKMQETGFTMQISSKNTELEFAGDKGLVALSALTNGYLQELCKNEKRELLVEQELKLDKDVSQLQSSIKNLQQQIKAMLLELSSSPDLHEELAATKKRVKDLQEEIKYDASTTKAQLLLLKQQFGELEKANNVSKQRELEFQKVCRMLNALEIETESLKKGNQELWMQTQEVSQQLKEATEKVETIVPVSKDDVLASRAEVLTLMSTNAELQKKVESLQISRFNEVEEVVYLRWVNACLQHDLNIYKHSQVESDQISNQADNKDDSTLCDSFGHSDASSNDDRKNIQEQNECTVPCSPQSSGHVNCAYSSTPSARYNQKRIEIPTLTIPHGHVGSNDVSPIASPLGQVEGDNLCTSASPSKHIDVSKLPMVESTHGFPKNSNVSPQTSLKDGLRKRSVLHDPAQQQPPFDCLQSPRELISQHNSQTMQNCPQKVGDVQSGLTVDDDRPSKLDVTSYITALPRGSQRRLGRDFTRSSSNLSSSPEGFVSQAQGTPGMQDRRYIRSSSSLFADSDISSANHTLSTMSLSRRHSASSVAEPPKMEDSTAVKAHSLDSHLDDSDRVVAAFRRLSVSAQAPHRHRSFKEVSRQNSSDEKRESNMQQPGSLDIQMSPAKSMKADFIWDLARAIEVTHYSSMEQVSAFVNWFDRQGETEKEQFFKFPDFPKDKVEAMRRAGYEYDELQALEIDLQTFKHKLKSTADLAIHNMRTLLEKVENHIEAFKQARALAIVQFGEFDLPTDWMLDTGAIAKIKQAALQLAQAFIKQVTNALITKAECIQVSGETLLLDTAKFLLQVHNFTGGFDEKTAKAFLVLQSQANIQNDDERYSSVPS